MFNKLWLLLLLSLFTSTTHSFCGHFSFFKQPPWQMENLFPFWHDEVLYSHGIPWICYEKEKTRQSGKQSLRIVLGEKMFGIWICCTIDKIMLTNFDQMWHLINAVLYTNIVPLLPSFIIHVSWEIAPAFQLLQCLTSLIWHCVSRISLTFSRFLAITKFMFFNLLWSVISHFITDWTWWSHENVTFVNKISGVMKSSIRYF